MHTCHLEMSRAVGVGEQWFGQISQDALQHGRTIVNGVRAVVQR